MAAQGNGVAAAANAAVANEPAYEDVGIGEVDALQIQQRYGEERAKRLRPEGTAQFTDLSLTDKYQHLNEDPWIDAAHPVRDAREMVPEGACKLVILGAGFGGLLYAVRAIDAGYKASDIRLIDTAGGFGGTWYHNRYPGLMCDVESYIYMPLLEETNYVPKHRYSYGAELREHANRIAKKYDLADKAIFQSQVTCMTWDEDDKSWDVEVVQARKGQEPRTVHIRSRWVAPASGLLNFPQLPGVPGMDKFAGEAFHTSRWNYAVTGGSQEQPDLERLKDKNVAIIGTGATAVQAIPHLAKWAKHLYVFQRTPSSVDQRGQRATDPAWFAKDVAGQKGWQLARQRNFMGQFSIDPALRSPTNLVDDGWTQIRAYAGLVGGPGAPMRMEDIPTYVQQLHAADMPRQAKVRARARHVVKDQAVAEQLLPWYPSWCKRPCFHDDYLDAFNRPNVTLVDTGGVGVSGLAERAVEAAGQSFPADVLVYSTGFRTPLHGTPAERANTRIVGRGGVTISHAWTTEGPATLHGVLARGFPNLLLPGPAQAAANPNQSFTLDVLARHGVHIMAAADKQAGGKPLAAEPTAEAAGDWGMQQMMRAGGMAGVAGCTPSYLNAEGESDRMTPEQQMGMARGGIWGQGMADYMDFIEAWRAKGGIDGIEVRT